MSRVKAVCQRLGLAIVVAMVFAMPSAMMGFNAHCGSAEDCPCVMHPEFDCIELYCEPHGGLCMNHEVRECDECCDDNLLC
jgi:hypothetical protein